MKLHKMRKKNEVYEFSYMKYVANFEVFLQSVKLIATYLSSEENLCMMRNIGGQVIFTLTKNVLATQKINIKAYLFLCRNHTQSVFSMSNIDLSIGQDYYRNMQACMFLYNLQSLTQVQTEVHNGSKISGYHCCW